MKKLLDKVRRRKHRATQSETSSIRITNETVAEHRERILAGGRKFKYPLQYPKYRIVLITIILVILVLAIISGITYWALYITQDTSEISQRITQILPLPVGEINGQPALYSDYLSELRSSLHYLSTKDAVNFDSDDGKRQLEYQKRLALDQAIQDAYVNQLASQDKITVNDNELNSFIQKQISNNDLGVTETMYKQVIQDYYNWTFDDYRAAVREQLLTKKVMAAVDIAGMAKINSILHAIQSGQDFSQLAKSDSEDPATASNGGDIGEVNETSAADPSGLIPVAMQLHTGQTSGVIEGVDGFYIVKLIDKNGTNLHLAKILVTYKTFASNLAALKKAGKVKEYINVPAVVSPTTTN